VAGNIWQDLRAGRASYGVGGVVDGASPLGPLVPVCPYCLRLGLLFAEAGVPFETYFIDGQDKVGPIQYRSPHHRMAFSVLLTFVEPQGASQCEH